MAYVCPGGFMTYACLQQARINGQGASGFLSPSISLPLPAHSRCWRMAIAWGCYHVRWHRLCSDKPRTCTRARTRLALPHARHRLSLPCTVTRTQHSRMRHHIDPFQQAWRFECPKNPVQRGLSAGHGTGDILPLEAASQCGSRMPTKRCLLST